METAVRLAVSSSPDGGVERAVGQVHEGHAHRGGAVAVAHGGAQLVHHVPHCTRAREES